ncbi:hypothetical protein FQZ97_824750 [compost metagenome]
MAGLDEAGQRVPRRVAQFADGERRLRQRRAEQHVVVEEEARDLAGGGVQGAGRLDVLRSRQGAAHGGEPAGDRFQVAGVGQVPGERLGMVDVGRRHHCIDLAERLAKAFRIE